MIIIKFDNWFITLLSRIDYKTKASKTKASKTKASKIKFLARLG